MGRRVVPGFCSRNQKVNANTFAMQCSYRAQPYLSKCSASSRAHPMAVHWHSYPLVADMRNVLPFDLVRCSSQCELICSGLERMFGGVENPFKHCMPSTTTCWLAFVFYNICSEYDRGFSLQPFPVVLCISEIQLLQNIWKDAINKMGQPKKGLT